MSTEEPSAPATRRRDPERRSRIIDAALLVIARDGVAGASMRRIADQADVPLGSMTYHFRDREDLLAEAFGRFIDELDRLTTARIDAVKTPAKMLDLVADLIFDPDDRHYRLLSYELWAYASRRPEMKPLAARGIQIVRRGLLRFFEKPVADAINALLDGAYIHRAYEESLSPRKDFRAMLGRIAGL
ncbi:TetR/AcrR family transcriptional regulator [Sutterella sp.]|uniref:TetR/AcrR family transcriptional regulator n=1 Tax=Sutterella sp. TaxID=1981025 RepID=UPI0026DF2582|nr:TetR family transcriptional regulator [Sutterella sp.]MDO5532336.1 TetR family transcriptional regulator [Sutterella sp.]